MHQLWRIRFCGYLRPLYTDQSSAHRAGRSREGGVIRRPYGLDGSTRRGLLSPFPPAMPALSRMSLSERVQDISWLVGTCYLSANLPHNSRHHLIKTESSNNASIQLACRHQQEDNWTVIELPRFLHRPWLASWKPLHASSIFCTHTGEAPRRITAGSD